jgi:hypothetical protein
MAESMAREIAALKKLTVARLRVKYHELFGEETRSRNKDYLWKRCAFRMQELKYGGLSEAAKERISELAKDAPVRVRGTGGNKRREQEEQPTKPRDQRLPPVGGVIAREHAGATHKVTVLEDGFEYEGQRYRSLSAIAKRITGTHWNGFTFFAIGPAKGS